MSVEMNEGERLQIAELAMAARIPIEDFAAQTRQYTFSTFMQMFLEHPEVGQPEFLATVGDKQYKITVRIEPLDET